MNGLLGALLLAGAVIAMVESAPTSPGLNDADGRRIIIHTSEEGIPENDNSGTKDEDEYEYEDEDEFDFGAEDPESGDDFSGENGNSGDNEGSGDAESTTSPPTTAQPEGTTKAEVTTTTEVTTNHETTQGSETTTQPEPTKSSGPFKCPQEYVGAPLFPDPEDCHFFYQCAHIGHQIYETHYRKACPAGLVFDPVHKICDWSYNHQDLC